MSSNHMIAPLVATCLYAACAPTLVAGAATAASAASSTTCTARVQTTRAVNLQHDSKDVDQIRARVGNTLTRERSYTLGQTRNTLGDGKEIFSDKTQFSLQVEVRNVAWLTIDARNITCANSLKVFTIRNGDAAYKVRVDIRTI